MHHDPDGPDACRGTATRARSTPTATRRRWAWLERLLFAVGVMSLGYYGYVHAETYLYQRVENRELNAIINSRAHVAEDGVRAPRRPYPAAGSTMGRVEIPRLGVSAIVRAGSDARTLSLAVGHVPGTALPGAPGNVGIAGHRDTFFRRLEDIRPGDAIVLTMPDGTFTYEVERTLIVDPTDVWVLDPTASPYLTLVTCYPFTFLGSAPERFIVRAALSR